MFCEKCGAQMSDGAVFCEKCGAPVDRTGTIDRPVEPEQTFVERADETNNINKKIIIIIISCAVVLLTVIALVAILVIKSGSKDPSTGVNVVATPITVENNEKEIENNGELPESETERNEEMADDNSKENAYLDNRCFADEEEIKQYFSNKMSEFYEDYDFDSRYGRLKSSKGELEAYEIICCIYDSEDTLILESQVYLKDDDGWHLFFEESNGQIDETYHDKEYMVIAHPVSIDEYCYYLYEYNQSTGEYDMIKDQPTHASLEDALALRDLTNDDADKNFCVDE